MDTWWGTFGAWARLRRAELALVVLLILFVPLVFAILTPAFRQADAGITRWIQRADSPPITAISEALYAIGSAPGLCVLLVPFGLYLWRMRQPTGAIFLGGSIFGHVLNDGIKAFFHRPRPAVSDQVLVLLPAPGTSFPSGHAMAATMFFGFLAVLIAIRIKARPSRRLGIAGCVTMIVLIGLSRIYLGDHFLSDVLGGYAVGLFFLILLVKWYQRVAPEEFRSDTPGASPVPAENRAAEGSSAPLGPG